MIERVLTPHLRLDGVVLCVKHTIISHGYESAGNDPGPNGANLADTKYDSLEGRALCKRILAKYLATNPHDYQLDGICSRYGWL